MFLAFGTEKIGLVGLVLFHMTTHHILLGNCLGIMALTLLGLARILWHCKNTSSMSYFEFLYSCVIAACHVGLCESLLILDS